MKTVYKDVLELRKDFSSLVKCTRAYVVPSEFGRKTMNERHIHNNCSAHWLIDVDTLSEYVNQALFIGVNISPNRNRPVREIYAGVITGIPKKEGAGYIIPVKYVNKNRPICTVEGGGIRAFYVGTAPQPRSPVLIKQWSSNDLSELILKAAKYGIGEYAEIEKIAADPTLKSTEKLQLILARVGQGKFRTNVMLRAGGQCDVTGFRNSTELLIASHILPWAVCTTKDERLDADNGLMLTPTLDRLFDRGFISFDDIGEMILRDGFSGDLQKLMPTAFLDGYSKLRKKPNLQQMAYLRQHRELHSLQGARRVSEISVRKSGKRRRPTVVDD